MVSRYLAFGLGLFALSVSAQDTEVKGARVSLARKPSAVLNVTIENRRDSPLVAWEIGVSSPARPSPGQMVHGSDFSGRKIEPWQTSGPIAPHERRTIAVDLMDRPEGDAAAMRLAVFDDGYYEGTADAVESWLKTRQMRIDDLRYWSGVLELMPRVSETDLRAYLTSRLADRAGQVVQSPSGSPVRWKLQEVLRRYPSGPEVWSALEPLRADTQRELAALTRQPSGGVSTTAGAVASVAILTQDRVASATLVATIENLRTVPLEALGLEVLAAATGRGSSMQGMDFGGVETPEPGHGAIKPREKREIPLYVTVGPNDALPQVRLSYVMFDDLVLEGQAAARVEVLKRREERAADYAFASAVLGEVPGRPVGEIMAFLMEKRAERARQLQSQGRSEFLAVIDELIRQAKESPARLLANAKQIQESYERQRERFMRHLGR